MAPRFLTILTGRNVPKSGSRESRSRRPSTKRRSRTSRAWSSRRELWSASRRLIKRDRRKLDAKRLRAVSRAPPENCDAHSQNPALSKFESAVTEVEFDRLLDAVRMAIEPSVSASVSAGQKGRFDPLSLHRKIPFLTRISETGSMTGWWVAAISWPDAGGPIHMTLTAKSTSLLAIRHSLFASR
jgi:hypothetical protein